MTDPPFRIEQLGTTYEAARKMFTCGVEALDLYLREHAVQDMKNGVAVTWVLWHREQDAIAGYYSLATGAIETRDLPFEIAKKMPRYDAIPVMLLGRLATSLDPAYRGRGLGKALLADALIRSRTLSRDIGAVGVITDAKGEQARKFYEDHGFIRFPAQPFRLVISMKKVGQLAP